MLVFCSSQPLSCSGFKVLCLHFKEGEIFSLPFFYSCSFLLSRILEVQSMVVERHRPGSVLLWEEGDATSDPELRGR